MSYTQPQARDAVRLLIQDGMVTQVATPHPFNVVRLEDLSDQVQAQATPTGHTFMVRFASVPTEEYVAVFAVAGTLVAYPDGSGSPVTPTVDVDANGNFTLAAAPVAALVVSYAWQYFVDSDIDGFLDTARSWLREFASVTAVPDGLQPALVNYAAAQALRALARKVSLADASAGTARINLSDLTKEYQSQADSFLKDAKSYRASYYSRGDEQLAPAAVVTSLGFRNPQPRR